MWPIVLAFGSVAFFLALAGKAKAESGSVNKLTPSTSPPALPEPSCKQSDKDFVLNVILAMKKGTASLELMRKAHSIALNCLPDTANAIEQQINKAILAAKAKKISDPEQALKAMMASPDSPPSPIPHDPKTDKPLWFMTTKKGQLMAIPNFSPVLALFKKLQSLVGASQDGRIGDETVTKFRNMMSGRGFKKFPTTAPALAANIVKYIAVLGKNVPPTQVGARGGSAAQSPFLGR